MRQAQLDARPVVLTAHYQPVACVCVGSRVGSLLLEGQWHRVRMCSQWRSSTKPLPAPSRRVAMAAPMFPMPTCTQALHSEAVTRRARAPKRQPTRQELAAMAGTLPRLQTYSQSRPAAAGLRGRTAPPWPGLHRPGARQGASGWQQRRSAVAASAADRACLLINLWTL